VLSRLIAAAQDVDALLRVVHHHVLFSAPLAEADDRVIEAIGEHSVRVYLRDEVSLVHSPLLGPS